MTWAPALRAISSVRSMDPSSTTIEIVLKDSILAGIFESTVPMTAASLNAGITITTVGGSRMVRRIVAQNSFCVFLCFIVAGFPVNISDLFYVKCSSPTGSGIVVPQDVLDPPYRRRSGSHLSFRQDQKSRSPFDRSGGDRCGRLRRSAAG